jgi:hypothetical protein
MCNVQKFKDRLLGKIAAMMDFARSLEILNYGNEKKRGHLEFIGP